VTSAGAANSIRTPVLARSAQGSPASHAIRPRVPAAGRRPSRGRLLAAVRVLVWMALWATALRNLGASVGVWAAGSLGAVTTLVIAVVIPAWLFMVFPGWVAFRIAAPRGMRRLAAAACWMSPLVRARDLPSVAAWFDFAADRPCPGWDDLPADAWTALAAALQADRRRAAARAAGIVDALAHLPAGARFPLLARRHAVEMLVVSAVSRRDWAAAARYAGIGQGRMIRFLALLARASAGEAVPRRSLWVHWLLAPLRRATFPLVRALARRDAAAPAGARAAAPSALAPHARHLALLEAAARHEAVRADDVVALAAAWQDALGDAALAALRARALELGVREGAARAIALREQVIDELALLLSRVDGEPARLPGAPFGETLAARARDHQLAAIKETLAGFDAERIGPALHPLEAWERWLALRTAWERVEESGGRPALAALWRAGARDGLWRSCCALSHLHGARAAWAVFVMFDWLADRAEYVGDLVAVLANRENARIALAAAR
jgi:hypothetical protein